ncbi:MAG TPA: MFS transporter [Micromonosporaceae bacterium]|nr:MFS transporter [Micromonosporaceae bacterium]
MTGQQPDAGEKVAASQDGREDPVRTLPAGAGSGGYRTVVVAASVGTFIELYDVMVYGYFASTLAEQFFPRADPNAALLATFAIFAVGFFVRPIGAIIFGHIGDRRGRRPALASSLLLMTFATVALGLLPTYASVGLLAPVLLLLCRVLQGISSSAEVPGAHLLILEHAPHAVRGRTVAINNAAGHLASAAAAAVGLVLARLLSPDQLAGWGWRVAFLIAAPIGLVGLYVRIRLLDSPAFLALGDLARQGRAPLSRALRTAKRGMLVIGVWAAVTSLGVYVLVGFLPSHLTRSVGLSAADAFAANLVAVLALASSALLGGYLADRYPLRRVAIGLMAGVAVVAVPGFVIITEGRTLLAAMIGQSLLAIFLGGTYTVGTILGVALVPVAVRFTAVAVAFNLGVSLFGSTAPYVGTWLVAVTQNPIAPGIYLSAAAACGLVAAVVGVPRREVTPPA